MKNNKKNVKPNLEMINLDNEACNIIDMIYQIFSNPTKGLFSK